MPAEAVRQRLGGAVVAEEVDVLRLQGREGGELVRRAEPEPLAPDVEGLPAHDHGAHRLSVEQDLEQDALLEELGRLGHDRRPTRGGTGPVSPSVEETRAGIRGRGAAAAGARRGA